MQPSFFLVMKRAQSRQDRAPYQAAQISEKRSTVTWQSHGNSTDRLTGAPVFQRRPGYLVSSTGFDKGCSCGEYFSKLTRTSQRRNIRVYFSPDNSMPVMKHTCDRP